MEITRDTRLMDIISEREVRSVLEWFGLPTGDRTYLRFSLADFCDAHDVDVEEVLIELSLGDVDDYGLHDEEDDEDDDWSNLNLG